MSNHSAPRKKLTRRNFLTIGGGALAVAAGTQLLPGQALASSLTPPKTALNQDNSPAADTAPVNISLVATDGWASLPGGTPNGQIYPDPYAVALGTGKTTYIFGFRNVTGLSDADVRAQKNKAQISAPLLYVDELQDVRIKLANLGLQQRPDLTDGHTIHWHGFRNAIPLFDGVPEMSVAVPIGADFTYYYKPRDPGTYMYHCHYEDVEHVQMGMTGVIFVRPALNTTLGGKYAYNDPSTKYDREFVIFLSEIWSEAHYNDAHIQATDWSDSSPDLWLMNGRVYPDTIKPNTDPMATNYAPGSDEERLQYQPLSSLIRAKSGEKVLLRFVNLGYQQHSMTLPGISMRVVGKDATLLKGRDSTDSSYLTNTVYFGPGESVDAIFTAPQVTQLTTYLLYNRKYNYLNNGGSTGLGGQLTEVRIYPANTPTSTLPNQTSPNT